MINRSNKPEEDYITAFLSCSLRPEDRPLADAIEDKLLWPMGFRCLTVGRNVSLPDQVDDAVREIMERVDCLIGIATIRLEAAEPSLPNRTLRLASPYILQESAMAHQRRLPFLIFKTPGVTLQAVTARNLYIEVRPDMPKGKPVFHARREAVLSSLEELKKRALENRKQRKGDTVLQSLHHTITQLKNGELKECPKCKEVRELKEFRDPKLASGVGRFCATCKGSKPSAASVRRGQASATAQQVTGPKPCPACGSRMILRNGRHGRFYGCAKYPFCRAIRPFSAR